MKVDLKPLQDQEILLQNKKKGKSEASSEEQYTFEKDLLYKTEVNLEIMSLCKIKMQKLNLDSYCWSNSLTTDQLDFKSGSKIIKGHPHASPKRAASPQIRHELAIQF